MLDVKQQKAVLENMSLNKSDITDFTGLEVSVTQMVFKMAGSEICLYSKYVDNFLPTDYLTVSLDLFLANKSILLPVNQHSNLWIILQ